MTTFTLLPAVDVVAGRVVRDVSVAAGAPSTSTDPAACALALQSQGAEWIHLVDVDAAFGRGSNAALLADVIGRLDVRVELSGGVRDDASLEAALATGCARVNLSTAALRDVAWCGRVVAAHGERVAMCLDVCPGDASAGADRFRLVARGEDADRGDLWETLTQLNACGCRRYVVTDVQRDGTLHGPNRDLSLAVGGATPAPVVVSGGVSSLEDLTALAEAAAVGANLEGAIVGAALHAGRFTLPEALEALRLIGRQPGSG